MEKQSLSDQHIIEYLKANYGIAVAKLIFLPWGASVFGSIYKAESSDGTSYFVKLKLEDHHDANSAIITLLQDAGIQQVIPFLKTIRGDSTLNIDGFTLSVSAFVKGQDGFSRNLTDDQWVTLGEVMRKIHALDVPPTIQAKIRRESYSPKWRQIVRSFYPLLASEPSGDASAVKFHGFMKKHITTIQRLVEQAEQLAQRVQNQSPQFVLCHSDLHAGNILMEGKSCFHIVDWDEPIMAPKERDLMFIGGAVGNVWNNPREEKLFYRGYGEAEINREILAYYRYERIVEDIAQYGQQLLLSPEGGQERIQAYKYFIAQFAPHGVVDIAFETGENH